MTARCLYWDTERNEWSSEGVVEAGIDPVSGYTVCHATHLTDFTSAHSIGASYETTFLEAGAAITDSVSIEDVLANLPLVVLLSGLWVAFIALTCWGELRDRRDIKNGKLKMHEFTMSDEMMRDAYFAQQLGVNRT